MVAKLSPKSGNPYIIEVTPGGHLKFVIPKTAFNLVDTFQNFHLFLLCFDSQKINIKENDFFIFGYSMKNIKNLCIFKLFNLYINELK